jgi:aspartate racemase
MTNAVQGEVWGVLGGMGPLASAEFVKSIYVSCASDREQILPVVLLTSDPSFPDRSEAILSGNEHSLSRRLRARLEELVALGSARLVICCVTAHCLLPTLPSALRRKVVSLVDTIISEVSHRGGAHLLLCSEGARRVKLFERHPRWPEVEKNVLMPDDADQREIHKIIYDIKRGRVKQRHLTFITCLMRKYQADSIIAACTEFHVLIKYGRLWRAGAPECIDPLSTIAAKIAGHQRLLTLEQSTNTGN